MTRPILDCMADALELLAGHWSGRRTPKAFYLGPDDWTEFMATNPPTVAATFNGEPTEEPAFREVPVRQSKNVAPRQSRIYDNTGTGRELRPDARSTPKNDRADIPADEVLDALDKLSRTRALTDAESLALEAAMKGRVIISKRDAARLGIKRQMGGKA